MRVSGCGAACLLSTLAILGPALEAGDANRAGADRLVATLPVLKSDQTKAPWIRFKGAFHGSLAYRFELQHARQGPDLLVLRTTWDRTPIAWYAGGRFYVFDPVQHRVQVYEAAAYAFTFGLDEDGDLSMDWSWSARDPKARREGKFRIDLRAVASLAARDRRRVARPDGATDVIGRTVSGKLLTLRFRGAPSSRFESGRLASKKDETLLVVETLEVGDAVPRRRRVPSHKEYVGALRLPFRATRVKVDLATVRFASRALFAHNAVENKGMRADVERIFQREIEWDRVARRAAVVRRAFDALARSSPGDAAGSR